MAWDWRYEGAEPPPRVPEVPGVSDLRPLGRGGMGQVYTGRDGTGRRVAVKLLAQQPTPRQLERFRREAELLARLRSPYVLTVHSWGMAGALPYLVCELIEGQHLDEAAAGRDIEGRLELLGQLFRAVAVPHREGIVHRDLKPNNVLVDEAGRVRVIDFGLSIVAEAERLTQTGSFVGTLAYAPPERMRKVDPDPREDVWSLGAIAYELLAEEPAYPCEEFFLFGRRTEPPPPLVVEGLEPALAAVILRALSPDPQRRFADAGALGAAFAEARAGGGGRRPARRAQLLAALLALGALGGLGALSAGSDAGRQPPASSPPASAEPASAEALARAGRWRALSELDRDQLGRDRVDPELLAAARAFAGGPATPGAERLRELLRDLAGARARLEREGEDSVLSVGARIAELEAGLERVSGPEPVLAEARRRVAAGVAERLAHAGGYTAFYLSHDGASLDRLLASESLSALPQVARLLQAWLRAGQAAAWRQQESAPEALEGASYREALASAELPAPGPWRADLSPRLAQIERRLRLAQGGLRELLSWGELEPLVEGIGASARSGELPHELLEQLLLEHALLRLRYESWGAHQRGDSAEARALAERAFGFSRRVELRGRFGARARALRVTLLLLLEDPEVAGVQARGLDLEGRFGLVCREALVCQGSVRGAHTYFRRGEPVRTPAEAAIRRLTLHAALLRGSVGPKRVLGMTQTLARRHADLTPLEPSWLGWRTAAGFRAVLAGGWWPGRAKFPRAPRLAAESFEGPEPR